MTMSKLLIVFVKHPTLGKVKTRLAATLGKEKALSVYKLLLAHTLSLCNAADAEVQIHYTDNIIQNDIWNNFEKCAQYGADLGERMFNALHANSHYSRKIIIGSDCFDLTPEHITNAFEVLDKTDTVLGPANDGGYYMFGMRDVHKSFFTDIKWSTENVLDQTIKKGSLCT